MEMFTTEEVRMIISGLYCSIDRLGFSEEEKEEKLESLINKIKEADSVYYEQEL